jgi:hypothetical protein
MIMLQHILAAKLIYFFKERIHVFISLKTIIMNNYYFNLIDIYFLFKLI